MKKDIFKFKNQQCFLTQQKLKIGRKLAVQHKDVGNGIFIATTP